MSTERDERPVRLGADAPGPSPIEEYGAIGDGRTVALVDRSGRIDWWVLPRLDSPPVVASLLDKGSGGFFSFAPLRARTTGRRYREGSNVLETEFETETGRAELCDAVTLGALGPLPWIELVREMRVVEGEVEVGLELSPGSLFTHATPFVRPQADGLVVDVGDQHLAVASEGISLVSDGRTVTGSARLVAGESALVYVTGSESGAVFFPAAEEVRERVRSTATRWAHWSSGLRTPSRYRAAVTRSALALSLLIDPRYGSIAAAPTSSLPEQPGGKKNYDYRYAWIRDSALGLEALMTLGMSERVHAALCFLLDAVANTAPQLHAFYGLDGRIVDETAEVDADGYLQSTPVRAGNSAAGQRQLGTYGDLFAVVTKAVERGHVLGRRTRQMLVEVADRCCDDWRLTDAGLWELSQYEHYTISKMQCWAALDQAVRLASCGHLPADGIDRWQHERDEIRSFVEQECWSDAQQSYNFFAGSNELDAAVLLAGRIGFDRGSRLAASARACQRELGEGPLMYRYSGMRSEEGTFLACAFWLVDALARTGNEKEATSLMDELVGRANDLGLLSEQQAPDGTFLGNFPQGLSHLALINAAGQLDELGVLARAHFDDR